MTHDSDLLLRVALEAMLRDPNYEDIDKCRELVRRRLDQDSATWTTLQRDILLKLATDWAASAYNAVDIGDVCFFPQGALLCLEITDHQSWTLWSVDDALGAAHYLVRWALMQQQSAGPPKDA